MYLAIDQYNNKTILPDKSYKTLKKELCAGKINKMYRDKKDGTSRHSGYVLGQGRGNYSLWVELFEIKPINT